MVARSVFVRTFFAAGATLLSFAFVYAETQSAKISVQPAAMTASRWATGSGSFKTVPSMRQAKSRSLPLKAQQAPPPERQTSPPAGL